MENGKDQIPYLIELLDDDSEQNVCHAMAALLKSDEASLDRCLCALQESENPRLRRRVHQLESAIRARRQRTQLGTRLKRSAIGLYDGVVQLHLLWFDNDLVEHVQNQWDELCHKFRSFCRQRPTLRAVADFLAKEEFHAPLNDDIAADFYCFGVVIDDHNGADVLLSVVAAELLRSAGVEASVVRSIDDFGVMDRAGNLLFPGLDFQYHAHRIFEGSPPELVVLDDIQVLRYIASILMLCAVACDSFRYVYTISNALSAFTDVHGNDGRTTILPYPYNNQKDPPSGSAI